jgi:hypothetical protein
MYLYNYKVHANIVEIVCRFILIVRVCWLAYLDMKQTFFSKLMHMDTHLCFPMQAVNNY